MQNTKKSKQTGKYWHSSPQIKTETRLISEAGDLSVDQIGRSRDWSETGKGVLLSDGDDVAVEVEIALDTLEVGLKEEGCGEEAVV